MINRSRILSVVLPVALLLAGLGRGEAEPFKMRLAQNLSPISALAIVAKGRGLFEQKGLDVAVSNFTTGKQCLDTVVGGGADVATTAEAPVTAAAMSGQPIAFLARIEYSDLKTVVANKAGIKSHADLKGKRIAFTAGTGSEVYTAALLAKAGLKKEDVTLVNLRPQEMMPAMAAGSIDAFDTWEPHISNARKAMPGDVSELDTRGVYSETFNIVVMKDYLAKNGPQMKSFLEALIAAETWIKANPDEAITLVAQAVGSKREELAQIWPDFVYKVVLDDRQLEVLKAHAGWRLASGNHPPGATMPDFSKVIVPDLLKSIDPARVTIALQPGG